MKVFMTGGTGFVGTYLSQELAQKGHDITILTRQKEPAAAAGSRSRFVTGDPKQEGPWMAEVARHDWIINLAGSSIFSKWTKESKQMLRDSRVLTTRNLVAALAAGELDRPPGVVGILDVSDRTHRAGRSIFAFRPPEEV